ncbi:sugar ABC transporter substrate-binding protein, partial [Streptococcus anginosus]|nr:sugar ABC transporter substrate-binding protein [Streptococcus anginosus]
MKIWKKLALATAALAMVGTLSACSSNKSTSSTSNKNQLTLWVDTEQVPYYKTIAKDFEKSHKGIKVRVTQS